MSNFIINGGKKLKGTIKTNSAKNSAVAILCATPMLKGKTTLTNIPIIEEVKRIIEILLSLGLEINWIEKHTLEIINNKKINIKNLNKKSFIKTRSALLLMGSLLARINKFSLPKSGGCELGTRTVSPFTITLEHLGVKVSETNKEYKIDKNKIHGNSFTMHESGDTATENIVMASVLAPGITEINLASPNYMVQDLCYFLIQAGANIKGIGTTKLTIKGVKKLKPVKNYPIMPDPIESMAFISIAITTKSHLKITHCPIEFLRLELEKLRIMGQKFKINKVYKSKNKKFELVDIEIFPSSLKALNEKIYGRPFPGLNIDNLPLFVPILTQAKGKTLVHDWVYENRAIYYTELNKLGASIELLDPHRVIVTGPTKLKSNEIICPPALRPSINILICMLASKGKSKLRNSYSINRGNIWLVA